MQIDPRLLKRLRTAKGLSRANLAKLSHVSAKQIQRLENPDKRSATPRPVTVDRLARALQVDPGVLIGEKALPESARPLAVPTVRVQHRLSAESQLAYDLVEQRYGVRASSIMNMAPLFFVLLAEGSLAWRRKELAELRNALENACRMGSRSNRNRAAWHAWHALDHVRYEDDAIDRRDLLNDPFPPDYEFDPDEKMTTSPFEEYLCELSDRLKIPGLEVGSGFVWSAFRDRMPAYSVCKDELESIAPNGGTASLVLTMGDVRITDIPEHLKSDNAAADRERWLERQVSEKTIEWRQEAKKLWEKLGLPVSTDESEESQDAQPDSAKEGTS